MRLRLWGDAVRLRLRDFGDGTARGTNVYEVLVDGVPREPLEARASQTEYVLAEGLVPGEHTVSLTKRTEGFVGRSELLGFDVHGELLEPPPPPALRMELVGDSITCGYGNAVAIPASGQPATGFHSVNEDVTRSYGWLAARSLGAEASVVCASGRGVFRNLDGSRTGTLPELYERVAPEADAPAWDASRQVPDIVVVNLGTNDLFAPGPLREQDFTGAYRRFVTHLRTLYPRAHLVLAVGSMLHDSPENPRWSNARAWVGALVRDARLAGDRHISFLAFEPQSEPFGEDWHPSAATHRAMAERLVAHLRRER
jgi:lysophospholipase L1-like esterase